MRTRAGVVLIEDDRVALIERHRAGLEYYVFPGGGMNLGETPQQAAIREAMEELGLEVVIIRELAIVHLDHSTQIYYLVKRVAGEFGTGTGEEFTDADPGDPQEGIYIPVWMPIKDLPRQPKVFPAGLAALVSQSRTKGWPIRPIVIHERAK